MRNIIRQSTGITRIHRAAQNLENVQTCMERIDGEEPPSTIELKVVRVPSQPQWEMIHASPLTSHGERQTHSFNHRFQHTLAEPQNSRYERQAQPYHGRHVQATFNMPNFPSLPRKITKSRFEDLKTCAHRTCPWDARPRLSDADDGILEAREHEDWLDLSIVCCISPPTLYTHVALNHETSYSKSARYVWVSSACCNIPDGKGDKGNKGARLLMAQTLPL
ncbi:hypothetical protein GQ607_015689 [Colletotrichum asianum]|uniref:Uncharacterized protein n=1 Tax=Colletotrichum asianum TaxID=702518 RepID=A0A8H3W2I7_9PEZI|nr:hypothetical protein GQ607_015689 [Colletotrichum asianum]